MTWPWKKPGEEGVCGEKAPGRRYPVVEEFMMAGSLVGLGRSNHPKCSLMRPTSLKARAWPWLVLFEEDQSHSSSPVILPRGSREILLDPVDFCVWCGVRRFAGGLWAPLRARHSP